MAELHDLFAVDASNIARFPEAQAPSTLNNGARALEGIVARYFFDTNHSVVATLSGSCIQMTANRTSITLTGTTSNYVADLLMAFTMGSNANIDGATVNINGIGAISLRDNNGASLSASAIPSGAKCLITMDGANNYFRLLRGGKSAFYDTGTWTPSIGGTATYTTQVGTWTRIGRLVFIRGHLTINSVGSGSGTTVSGLPFTSNSNLTPLSIGLFTSIATSLTSLMAYIPSAGATVIFTGTASAVVSATDGVTVFQNSARVEFSGCYETA